MPSPVHEIQRLGAVLSDASLRLRTREAERDRALADTRRGLTALSESEARFRHMADSAPALIWMTDESGGVSFANLHFEHMFGIPAADLTNEGWERIVHADDLESFRAAFAEAFEARAPFRTEVRVIDRGGAVRWLRCEGVPRLDDDQNFLGYTGCNIDITDAKFAEEHLLLLIHELNHRVKNTLATVQSIAGQSLRNLEGPEADAARAAFEARLLALARVHDVLTRESWEGAELSAVVADAIRPLESGDGHESRFSVVGPALRLPPRLALSIAMALHELGTNAVKYGALSIEGGTVEISWTVRREAEIRLYLRWAERGGPPVKKPTRTGLRLTPDRAQPRPRAGRRGDPDLRGDRRDLHDRCARPAAGPAGAQERRGAGPDRAAAAGWVGLRPRRRRGANPFARFGGKPVLTRAPRWEDIPPLRIGGVPNRSRIREGGRSVPIAAGGALRRLTGIHTGIAFAPRPFAIALCLLARQRNLLPLARRNVFQDIQLTRSLSLDHIHRWNCSRHGRKSRKD